MANIICRALNFAYPGTDVFKDLDLLIDTGWRAGLVGRNGRGKTTLLRLLHGALEPTGGHIEGTVPTYLFPYEPPDPTLATEAVVKDAVGPYLRMEREMTALLGHDDEVSLARYGELQTRFETLGGYEIDGHIDRELDALAIGPRLRAAPFSNLSGGERTRSLLAALFARPDTYALIDEPTNHLDLVGRHIVASYLATKTGFLLVSHDRTFLDESIDHVVALNPDTVTVQRGNYTEWRRQFDDTLAYQDAKNQALKREIRQLTRAALARREGAHRRESDKAPHADKGFIGHRAAKQMRRALNIERRVQADVETRKTMMTDQEKTYILRFPPPETLPRSLLTANNLRLSFGTRRLLDDVSITITPGERVAVIGPNGCGKTTLLDVLCRRREPDTGHLQAAGHIRVLRTHQDVTWQHGSLAERLAEMGLDTVRFRQVMAALGVRGEVLDQPLEQLSAGQKKKLDLARVFTAPAELLVWDEPMNYLDIESRDAIIAAIDRDRPTMVFVEHDRHFVEHVATRILRLAPFANVS